eukprot:gene8715-1099_t
MDSGRLRRYMITDAALYEIMQWSDSVPRSWIMGDVIEADGVFYVCMRVDPIFLVLPYLIKTKTDKNAFMALDVILPIQEYPGFRAFDRDPKWNVLDIGLRGVCDVHNGGDILAFRLNYDKLKMWLKAKVIKCARAIPDHLVPNAAASMNFVSTTSSADFCSKSSKLRYAIDILSRFLSDELRKQLQDEFIVPNILMIMLSCIKELSRLQLPVIPLCRAMRLKKENMRGWNQLKITVLHPTKYQVTNTTNLRCQLPV